MLYELEKKVKEAIIAGDDSAALEHFDSLYTEFLLDELIEYTKEKRDEDPDNEKAMRKVSPENDTFISALLENYKKDGLDELTDAQIVEFSEKNIGTDTVSEALHDALTHSAAEALTSGDELPLLSSALQYNRHEVAEKIFSTTLAPQNGNSFELECSTGQIIGNCIEDAYHDIEDKDLGDFFHNMDEFFARPIIQNYFKEHPEEFAEISETLINTTGVRDMLDDFTNHVIFPASLLLMKDGKEKNEIVNVHAESNEWSKNLRKIAQKNFFQNSTDPLLPLKLSRSWHEPVNSFPSGLTPLTLDYEWHPLIAEDASYGNKHITCLTHSRELKQEGITLHHCVGTSRYDAKCSQAKEDESTHIISIREKNGRPTSTAELSLSSTEYNREQSIEVVQHYGQHNNTPSQEDQDILRTFINDLQKNKISFAVPPQRVGEYGETDESKQVRAASNTPQAHQIVGFEPSWEHVEEAFNEYRKNLRSAFTGIDEENENYITTDDKQPFLMGNATTADSNTVPNRDLSAKAWLKSSGVMDDVARLLNGGIYKMPHDSSEVDEAPIERISNDERYALMGYDEASVQEMRRWNKQAKSNEAPKSTFNNGTFVARGGESISPSDIPQR